MLSVGSRDAGRKGIGLAFVSALEESEMEEGEACFAPAPAPDRGALFDPDSFTHIDQRLHDLLGHLQKDFEGGVSAENLGTKFGGYGSFLSLCDPTYDPPFSYQTKSPPKQSTPWVTRSPLGFSSESVRQNAPVPTHTSITRNDTGLVAPLPGNTCKKSANTGEVIPQECHLNKQVEPCELKPLKVRIKVAPESAPVRDIAAIYSGLGLDISPSSSLEGSAYGSDGLSPENEDGQLNKSPTAIIKMITSFEPPEGYLLSPLPENLLHLKKKANPVLKIIKAAKAHSTEDCFVGKVDSTPIHDAKGPTEKKTKSSEKNRKSTEETSAECKDPNKHVMKRELVFETSANQNFVSNSMNGSLHPCVKDFEGKQVGDSSVSLASKGAELSSGPNERISTPVSSKCNDMIGSPGLPKCNDLKRAGNVEETKDINFVSEPTDLKGKSNTKLEPLDKALKVEKRDSLNNDFMGRDMSRNFEVEKTNENAKEDCDVLKVKKDGSDPLRLKSASKAGAHRQDGEKVVSEKESACDGKSRFKGSKDNKNSQSLDTVMVDEPAVLPSMASNQKRKSSHAKEGNSESKLKRCKPDKEPFGANLKEKCCNFEGDAKVEPVGSKTALPISNPKLKVKDAKLEHNKHASFEKQKEKSTCKKVNNCKTTDSAANESQYDPSPCDAPNADIGAASNAAVLIEDTWVCCDKCQTWRLLPSEFKTAFLPQKWLCSMQTWFTPRGMNKCSFTEDETTKAIKDMDLPFAPENNTPLDGAGGAAFSSFAPSDGQYCNQNISHDKPGVQSVGKIKKHPRDTSSVTGKSSSFQLPNSSKTNQQASAKSRSLNDDTSHDIGLTHTYPPFDSSPEMYKHTVKHKLNKKACHLDEGDLTEQDGAHYKSNQNGLRASKKLKVDSAHELREDCNSDLDAAAKVAINVDNGYSTNLTGKSSHKYTISSSKLLNCELNVDLPETNKKAKSQPKIVPNGKFMKNGSNSELDKPEIDHKIRKLKESKNGQGKETLLNIQQLVDNNNDVKEALSESEARTEKKARAQKSEEKELINCKVDDKAEKKVRVTKIILSANRERIADGMEESRGLSVELKPGRYQENAASQSEMHNIDPVKKEGGNGQLCTGAISSSSKVSCSLKSKTNFQEARGSPVESVSSSPLRITVTGKLATLKDPVQKDLANGGFTVMENLGYSDGEDGDPIYGSRKTGKSSVQQRTIESHSALAPGIPDQSVGTYEKVAKQQSGSQSKNEKGRKKSDGPHGGSKCEGGREQNKYLPALAEKDDDARKQPKINSYHASNGHNEWKSGKSSSSRSKERSKSSKAEIDKGKHKDSELHNREGEFGAKVTSSSRFEDISNSSERLSHLRDMRNEISNCQTKDYAAKKCAVVRGSTERRKSHLNHVAQKHADVSDSGVLRNQNKDVTLKAATAGDNKSDLNEHPMEVPSHERTTQRRDRTDRSEFLTERGEQQSNLTSSDKAQAHCHTSHSIPLSMKECKSVACSTDSMNCDSLKATILKKKHDSLDGVQPTSMRQGTPTGTDVASPLRRDVHYNVFREARDLKHRANRLKSDGLDQESTELYFQAVLKFLHYASLLEASYLESGRHGETSQIIHIYSETAKFCEFVANEYEKVKDMAAAALAYKCVEVAYMKVSYLKHSSASKDRHELQMALQMVLPGESPSSSASDVDNLNIQGVVDRPTSAKGVNSPQINASHVIAARHKPNFQRLLNYVNETVSAFEASKKSQHAISIASSCLEKNADGGLSSVKKALDFDYHNVQGLLHLMRLSIEAIGH